MKAGGIAVATLPLLRAKKLTDIVMKAEVSHALCDKRLEAELEAARRAAAWYPHSGQFWPKPYLPGRDLAYRLAMRDREEWTAGRLAMKPPSHEVRDEPLKEPAAAASGKGPGKKAV